MGAYNDVFVKKVFSAQSVSASGIEWSEALDLGSINQDGLFSLQLLVTGDGTLQVEYELSHDGVNFVTPTTALDIVSAFTKTSGPGSDGKDIYSFDPELGRFMKIKVTETGGANAAVITAHLASQ
jgi:hypothetical protein